MDAPLDRKTLAEQLTRRLTLLITTQGLKSGDQLPSEASISARFGVSRAITREALRALQERGIVEIVNGKRATVRPLTSDPLSNFFRWAVSFERRALVELLEVRKGLEVQSAALAATRRTPGDIAALRDTVARMAEQLHDADAYTELDYRLHLQIAVAAHNEMLHHLIASIHEPFKGTIREGLLRQTETATRRYIQRGHEKLVAMIESGDVAATVAVMSGHLDEAWAVVAHERVELPEDSPTPIRS